MSGYKQFNFPAFDEVAEELRNQGYTIISPAELDDPKERVAALASPDGKHVATQKPWGFYLARDIKFVCEVDGVVVLNNWQLSRGARLETFVADTLGKPIYSYEYPFLQQIRRSDYVETVENVIELEYGK
jgi:hypothetical protein